MPRCLAANSTCVCKGSNCQRLWVPASASFCVVISLPPNKNSIFGFTLQRNDWPHSSLCIVIFLTDTSIEERTPVVKDVILLSPTGGLAGREIFVHNG